MSNNWQNSAGVFPNNPNQGQIYSRQQQDSSSNLMMDEPSMVDNIDLGAIIGEDFMAIEQYQYPFQCNNLTEFSPEETEKLLEDQCSVTGSKSTISDDFTDSSHSMQNSPGAFSSQEDLPFCQNLSFEVKAEEFSPGTNSVELTPNSPRVIPYHGDGFLATYGDNGAVHSGTDVGQFLQQATQTANPPQDFSAFLQQSNFNSGQRQDTMHFGGMSPILDESQAGKRQSTTTLPHPSVATKKSNQKQQPEQLVNLLKGNQGKQKNHQIDAPKRGGRGKRQNQDTRSDGSVKTAKKKSSERKPLSPTCSEVKTEAPSANTQISQVVMFPQVVFTSGSSTTNANQSEIAAYLATSSKQVMTTLPIKIVSANSCEIEKIPINPISKKQGDNVFKRKGESIEKKPTNHNEVEKRYRKSITDTLEELKETLFGGDTKCTKAGILRKAIDCLKHYKKINQKLRLENTRLKMAQKHTSVVDLLQSHQNMQNLPQSQPDDFDSLTSSDDDDVDLLIDEPRQSFEMQEEVASPTTSTSSAVESVQGGGTFSMTNKQRFFVSMFMFAFMFAGPSSLLFGTSNGPSKDYARPHTGGRTILSTGSYDGDDGFKAYSGLIVNGILYLLFFAWLLIKGEPRFPRDCKPLSLFATYMKKADIEMKKGDFQVASLHVERALRVIGRPWSTSKLDVIPSLIWHSVCHVLHQIGLLSVLKSIGWIILPRRHSFHEAVSRYRASCALAAQAYAKLLELALLDGESRRSKLLCAQLSMAAINMAENGETVVTSEMLMKIYFNYAIMLSVKFGKVAKPIMHVIVNRAKAALSYRADDVPDSMAWALHPVGSRYILSGAWSRDFKREPLLAIKNQFLMSHVEAILKQMLTPSSTDVNLSETEQCLSLLKQCSAESDKVSIWWYNLLCAVFYINIGMKQKARAAWESIDDRIEDVGPYAGGLFDLVECYFDAKDVEDMDDFDERLTSIEKSVHENFIYDEGKAVKGEFNKFLAFMCAEMALNARVMQWEQSSSRAVSRSQLEMFEQDLNVLQHISAQYKGLSKKACHFKEVMRVMAGSNPLSIAKQIFKNSRTNVATKAENDTMQSGEFQEAKTMLFIFKHLPSIVLRVCPQVCRTQLENFGFALEKSGFKELTDECKKILAIIKTP